MDLVTKYIFAFTSGSYSSLHYANLIPLDSGNPLDFEDCEYAYCNQNIMLSSLLLNLSLILFFWVVSD